MVFGEMSLSNAIDVLKTEQKIAEESVKLLPNDTRLKNFISAVDTVNNYIDKSVGVFMSMHE